MGAGAVEVAAEPAVSAQPAAGLEVTAVSAQPAEPLPPPATCGWARCQECAAHTAFTAKWNAGQIRPRDTVTSPWWESAEAAALYTRRVNLKETS